MPATTPNRGYQYPVAGDPVNIPGDLQTLAEDIDDDVCALTAAVPLRPAAQYSASQPQVIVADPAGTSAPPQVSLTEEDFNTGLVTVRTAVGGFTRIYPQVAGHYMVMGSITYPRPTSGTNLILMSVRLYRNATTTSLSTPIARSSNSLQPSASDGIRTISAATTVSMNGTTDYLTLAFFCRTAAGGAIPYTVADRRLTIVRMSPTP